jgi:hypothetical protein
MLAKTRPCGKNHANPFFAPERLNMPQRLANIGSNQLFAKFAQKKSAVLKI